VPFVPIELPPETPEDRAWREEILAKAKPLPPASEIWDPPLTEEEAEAFMAALEDL
jgi:hypothetical protein